MGRTMNIYEKKLIKIFNECDKHILRINSATKKMSNFMELYEDKFINLSEDEIEHIDQFLFRFSKLQDAMGQKLFKTMLVYLNEDIESKAFIDILNIMEKLYLIEDVNDWKELREDRNELANNYDDDPEGTSKAINKLYNKKDVLINIYQTIKANYENR